MDANVDRERVLEALNSTGEITIRGNIRYKFILINGDELTEEISTNFFGGYKLGNSSSDDNKRHRLTRLLIKKRGNYCKVEVQVNICHVTRTIKTKCFILNVERAIDLLLKCNTHITVRKSLNLGSADSQREYIIPRP
jgi:hypothetical protein